MTVPTRLRRRPPRLLVPGLALGRLATGVSFLVAPRLSVTMLGVDTVTAERMVFLARMTAARDAALALGALAAARRGSPTTAWVVAGAACDAADALAIGAAAGAGRLDPVRAGLVAAAAGGAAAAGAWAVS